MKKQERSALSEVEGEKMHKERHSLAHILAMAVLKKFPEAKLGIGPVIDNGFYYDFLLPEALSDKDLPKIRKDMQKIIQQKVEFKKNIVSREEALKKAKANNDPFKEELINDLPANEEISFYSSGDFADLCRGPHVNDSSEINPKAFALTSTAGAYWRGDEKNQMLTRVYGVAFETKEELDEYLELLAEAKKRDHRKLGKEMDLFVFSELIGPGLPVYTPKGASIRKGIVDFSNALQKTIGYDEVHSPQINKAELFKISGHYDKFKDDMISAKSHYSKEEFFLKPMNCPQHTQIYASRKRSYRDLPLRYADSANLFRDEKPGEMSGLTRLRCFSQDDGHSFCREDQIEIEFKNVLDIINQALEVYGLDYFVRLSLWDPKQKEKYLGDASVWEKSQALLEKLLKDNKIKYETEIGEAAFYGPKMDIVAKDALKREWQISTIQLDFNMPVRFKLTYTDKDGSEKNPVMIHRAITGSPERFMGILIEHYGGAFPLWLAPTQIKIISVGEGHIEHCQKMAKEFNEEGVRIELDISDETVGNKIRKSSQEKIPYTLVIGDKEMNSKDLSVRVRGKQDLLNISKEEFITKIKTDIKNRSLELL
ncbi:MAG: threonine--tRNA ligase [Candidatus Komeilibacteria bacterium]|jgi:threonyl-tRNA synthetase|nr:threonine--tRNA ligase [Candidatus Komeilibacteria bacterium]MBT4447901.1 threonine--tRNA ligase [Candidatus Komeilibacteria bacterium]